MWRKPGAKPLRFQATQDFAIEEVAFAWRARFRRGVVTDATPLSS
jgi:hypothetical protein